MRDLRIALWEVLVLSATPGSNLGLVFSATPGSNPIDHSS